MQSQRIAQFLVICQFHKIPPAVMKLLVFLLICLFTVTHTNILASSLSSRIVNGATSAAGQFPYQAMVVGLLSNGQSLCGGTLISSEWIVTAAHCVVQVSQFEIHLGAQKFYEILEPGRVVYRSNQAIAHENYNPYFATNDIALIKLSRKVQMSDRIKPATLPAKNLEIDGETVIATGWGLKTTHGNNPADELQYAEMRAISNKQCTKSFNSQVIQASTLCAQGVNYESTCFGDSGGPLVRKKDHTLVGVTSFGSTSGCDNGYPSAFTRVSSYIDWIKAKTGISV